MEFYLAQGISVLTGIVAVVMMQFKDMKKILAGQILAKIHSIPAPIDAPDWEGRFNAKIDRKITMYKNCELKYESGGEAFLEYIAQRLEVEELGRSLT